MMFSSRSELVFVLLLAFCLFLSKSVAVPLTPAPNCARSECPSYTVIHTDKDFEVRSYNRATWVAGPNMTSNSYTDASNKGYTILSNYFNGNNAQHVKIGMTLPVIVGIQNSAYQVFLYVPQKYQSSLPTPLSNDVKPIKFPGFKYAVARRFSGVLNDGTIMNALNALKKSLQGTPYQKATNAKIFAVGGYNSPYEVSNRVNEVFLAFN